MLLDLLNRKTLLEKEYIINICESASESYKHFVIPKKNGDLRHIYQPSMEVKCLQKVILDEIIEHLPVHESCFAYRKKLSISHHAEYHKDAKFMLRMDFKNFFNSISIVDVNKFCTNTITKKFPDWNDEDTYLFCRVVSHYANLTIGAVTSPGLSNAMCYELDVKLSNLAASYGLKYSRYADDMFFSSKEKGKLYNKQKEIIKIIKENKFPSDLFINHKKTFHSSKKGRMSITGLIITNSGDISIGREKKREIRTQVYRWDSLNESEKSHLSGYLSFIKSVEPEFINTLCGKYGATLISKIMSFQRELT